MEEKQEEKREDTNRKNRLERIDKKIAYIEKRIETLMEGVKDEDLTPSERMDIANKFLSQYMRLEQLRRSDELELNVDSVTDSSILALVLQGEKKKAMELMKWPEH
jgi:ATP-dependent protease ClpP protease subunit